MNAGLRKNIGPSDSKRFRLQIYNAVACRVCTGEQSGRTECSGARSKEQSNVRIVEALQSLISRFMKSRILAGSETFCAQAVKSATVIDHKRRHAPPHPNSR